ncbi:hypothetical protein DPMN_054756 [Dreissena polymorpha]|uniref:Uncharacterized protein n=1 Tax=Dreissena polymorpha TaxID=45954 RepID=A0A9D4CNP2_DREPO|nr:hypothetical protein DPMN_054756 [Dreissena polymorpha]
MKKEEGRAYDHLPYPVKIPLVTETLKSITDIADLGKEGPPGRICMTPGLGVNWKPSGRIK